MKLYIKKTGILSTKTDIIVNAANNQLQEGGGVCGVIFNAVGSSQLTKECKRIGYCKTGDAVITKGFNVAKYIIHAVGPIWYDGNHHEPQDLYNCYQKSLDLLLESNCKSITFPLISAGIFGYPVDKAFRKALQACNDWNNKHNNQDIEVIFAIPEDDKYNIGINEANKLNINIE